MTVLVLSCHSRSRSSIRPVKFLLRWGTLPQMAGTPEGVGAAPDTVMPVSYACRRILAAMIAIILATDIAEIRVLDVTGVSKCTVSYHISVCELLDKPTKNEYL